MSEKNLDQAHYQPDHLWIGGKAIREPHKIMSTSKEDVKSWLVKQALWQVHEAPPKEINHPRCEKTWWAAPAWSALCAP